MQKKEIEKKPSKVKELSLMIEDMTQKTELTHMEAILLYCENMDLDPVSIKPLISKALIDKIEVNAIALHQLPKKSTLPEEVWQVA